MTTLSKKLTFKSFQFHLEIQTSHVPKKSQAYLAISLVAFLLFLLNLVKANQNLLASQINAQSAPSGVELIRENDLFSKFDPNQIVIKDPPPPPPPTKKPDPRLLILQKYLSQFNSPLKEHAQDFLDAADSYQIDWRLVPAIAGVESTFGRSIPGGHDPSSTSYNGWGWGVYGDKVLKFTSWRQAIFAVTKGLKNNYIDKGLTDPLSLNKKYASSPYWAGSLTYFLNDLDSFTSQNLPPQLSEPQKISDQLFAQYAYIKVVENHFELELSQ